ncbi:MAG: DUF6055 domain-containing protein [Polyangiaceae bacterium]|nr:DUF6055 domain-containing protein [Polyangiaceae bacterium]
MGWAIVCFAATGCGGSEYLEEANADRSETAAVVGVYQAENYSFQQGCSKASNRAGYTGSGFMAFGGSGSLVEWNVSAPSAGQYRLVFRYANGSTSSRRCAVAINDAINAGNLAFGKTGAWSTWATTSIDVTLKQGNNRVRVTANTSAGGPNLDKMELIASSGGGDGGVPGKCAEAREGNTATLSCSSGEVIKAIAFASYGVPKGACSTSFATGTCHAASSRSKVEALCLNKQSCQVRADNGTFGDPCVGTSKKLAIKYSCGTGGGDDDDGGGDVAQCYKGSAYYPDVPAGLSLNTVQTNHLFSENAQIYKDGIFAVHAAGISQNDAKWLLARLAEIRCVSLAYGMKDPPPVQRRWYYNVFVHTGVDGFGNGQGTDSWTNMPFLTLPSGASMQPGNVDHEGFHIFQYRSNSPGFAYSGDSMWFIEAAAQWFAATRLPDEPDSFVEAGAIVYNPHLALWHSFNNKAPGDPGSDMWTYGVRQYGLHTWLIYLTERRGVPRNAIPAGSYSGTSQSPQEYYYRQVGTERMRTYFADWVAHSRADFDYLTRAQAERAQREIDHFISKGNKVDPYVAELSSAGTGGAWRSPPAALKPRGWSFNTVRIPNPASGSYTLAIQGDPTGSAGAASHFEGRVVVMYGEANGRFTAMNMANNLSGNATVTVNAGARELYLVVAAVPEHFAGNQNYGYKYRITGP